MQGAFEAGAVVGVKVADARHHIIDVGVLNLNLAELRFAMNKTRHRHPSQIQHNFDQVVAVVGPQHRLGDGRG